MSNRPAIPTLPAGACVCQGARFIFDEETSHGEGRQGAAIAYSLVQTCDLHGIEPFAYLTDVLRRLPAHPINRVAELLAFRCTPTAG